MDIFCLSEFKEAFEKLKTKKSYKTIEQELISYFFGKNSKELCSGVRLNNSRETPFIKKRLGGRGGFRFYFLLILKKDKLYLMFVHAKSGTLGADNITDKSKAMLYKKVLTCIQTNDLFKLELDTTKNRIRFEKTN